MSRFPASLHVASGPQGTDSLVRERREGRQALRWCRTTMKNMKSKHKQFFLSAFQMLCKEQEQKDKKLQSSASGRRRKTARGAAGSGETPPEAATDGASGAAGRRDKPQQATGRRGKAKQAPEDDEPVQAAGRDERPEAAGRGGGEAKGRQERGGEGRSGQRGLSLEDSD